MLSFVIVLAASLAVLISFVEILDRVEHNNHLKTSEKAYELLSYDIIDTVSKNRIGEVLSAMVSMNQNMNPEQFRRLIDPVMNETMYFTHVYLLDQDRDAYEEHLSEMYNQSIQITDFGTLEVSPRRAEYWPGYLAGVDNFVCLDFLSSSLYTDLLAKTEETGEVSFSVPFETIFDQERAFIEIFPFFEIEEWGGVGLLGRLTVFDTLFETHIHPEDFVRSGRGRHFETVFRQNNTEHLAFEYGQGLGTTNDLVFAIEHRLDFTTELVVRGYEGIEGLESSVKLSLLFVGVILSVALAVWEFLRMSASKDLRRAAEQAECASVEKSRFVSNMSHEIRTPLNGIIGMTDVMERSSLDHDARYCTDVIRSCGSSLLRLVNNILDIASIEAGEIHLNMAEVDVRTFMMDLVSDSWTTMSTRCSCLIEKTTLSIDSSVPVEAIKTDPDRVGQVLTNLLTNAFKYTQKGVVGVEVCCTPGFAKGTVLFSISVVDTGLGMSPESVKGLFRAFSRFHSDRQIEGTGIGLCIAKGVAEKLGGDISCESTLGKGSTFVFTFVAVGDARTTPGDGDCAEEPFRQEYTKHQDLQRTASSSSKAANADCVEYAEYAIRSDARILVADDTRINRTILLRFLERHGCVRVDVAEDGRAAVAMCEKAAYDVILIDNVMPHMGGKEATSVIRKGDGPSRGAVIIVVSADVLRSSIQEYFGAGADGFIPKPFRKKDLLNKLLELSDIVVQA